MGGELGVARILRSGANVYSALEYAQNSPQQQGVIESILAQLTLRGATIDIPPEAVGAYAPGMEPMIGPVAQPQAIASIPFMRMPWDDRDREVHRFTSGPHNRNVALWQCNVQPLNSLSALDFGMDQNTPILAVASGRVYRIERGVTGIGGRVIIEHNDGFATEYWHLNSIDQSLRVGEPVGQGRRLGASGTAGSGPHLHLDFSTVTATSRVHYPIHGVNLLENRTAWAFLRPAAGDAYNYQGTLTTGTATQETGRYTDPDDPRYPDDPSCSVEVTTWRSSEWYVEAGSGEAISSTNLECPAGQLRAEYFDQQTPGEQPRAMRCEKGPIVYDWGAAGPGYGLPVDHFSIRWTGVITFTADTFTFLTETDDGIRVWVDGEALIDAWYDQGLLDHVGERTLTAGAHEVRVEYYENEGGAAVQVHWWPRTSDPDDGRTLRPDTPLWGVVRPESDEDFYTFAGITGQRAQIWLTKQIIRGLDPFLTLVAPDGTTLAYDDDSGDDNNAYISVDVLPQTGSYRVIARSYAYSSGGLYSLMLQLRTPGEPDRLTYDAGHGSALPGNLARREGAPATGDADTDSAHDDAGRTHLYYWSVFGRDSYDNNGATITSTVHFGRSYLNAYWNGSQMVYGDGFAVTDVVAHELTHAVIERTANLEYRWQSGALNESLADIFAAMVDRDDWLIGDDLPSSALGGRDALRDLADPARLGQPAHVDNWKKQCEDEEGVHSNSGVTNKAFYNIATAITKEKAEKIFFNALLYYLGSTASLEQMRAAALQAAADLYGAESAEYTAVGDGFAAVGLDGVWNPPSNSCSCAATAAMTTAAPAGAASAAEVLTTLYQVRDLLLRDTAAGAHYRGLYYTHTGRITRLLLADPPLGLRGAGLLRTFTPGLAALVHADAAQPLITDQDVAEVVNFLDELAADDRAAGGGALAAVIEREKGRVDWGRLPGMSFSAAWVYINSLNLSDVEQLYLPVIRH
jgi:murein DD-endopeptidase MepM/ murein hydrolase activator NlpD